jgi:DNA-binding transcriptional ArsR family regulator
MTQTARAAKPQRLKTSRLFAALGDETRLYLMARLSREGPQSITRLSAGSSRTRQSITKHLHALERAGLASSRRGGRERIWSLEPHRLQNMQLYLDSISSGWDAAIGRLRQMVEEDDAG